ncbi:MAG: glycosyltransferase family 4 protein [Prevotella sp.]|nr:glycosyltransferase family 4 protein [Prevotella sp.]
MKLAILTCGMLPIPAVQGGAVENLIDFYLEYNDTHKLHDITVYSPWNEKLANHPALASDVNHYIFIDVTSLKARIARKLRSLFHSNEYYNYFIEYYFERVYAILKKQHFDYIILENCDGYAYKLSQRGYKNLILHMHNERRTSRSMYDEIVYNNITKIVTVSNYIKKTVPSFISKDRIQTVYNGIDLKSFTSYNSKSAIYRKSIGLSDDDFVIVYNGRINEEKGISELIEAMLLLKGYAKIKLLIIGGTFFGNAKNDNKFVRSLKEKIMEIEDKCVFTGFIPYSQVPLYLRLADIAVLPSMWDEPFGLTIVEAMAADLPLITTLSGGIPEICEGVATIVNKDNIVNNLVSAILDLYNNPEKRKQMSATSIERAKLFDKETYAKNFFAAIESIS